MKLLEEKVRIAELEAEATLTMEQQKAETQAKIFQPQREVVRDGTSKMMKKSVTLLRQKSRMK